jgi:hypothetical protein
MITGFEIEFYEPPAEVEAKKGRLILDENGKYLIEMTGSWTGVFRVIDVIYARAIDSGQL